KDLPQAPKQGRTLGEYLKKYNFNVKYFLDDETKVDKKMIDDYLDSINDQLNPDGDVLLFYFGGHGVTQKSATGGEIGYLLPHTYDKNRIQSSAISMVYDIKQRYVNELRAKHILFAIDACVADVGLRNKPPSEKDLNRFTALADLLALTKDMGRTILTAGSK